MNSFTQSKYNVGVNPSKSFHLKNCESLESIEIGEYSFNEYYGEFELKKLPQLQIIYIGYLGRTSRNFFGNTFIVRGMI